MKASYAQQISELKNLSYIFYERLALAGDPLTYTFQDNKDSLQIQVEVEAKMPRKLSGVLVTIYFCSDQGKWMHTSDAVCTYLVTNENEWKESSYDGTALEN